MARLAACGDGGGPPQQQQRENEAVLLDMGEYLHRPTGKELPLLLSACDLVHEEDEGAACHRRLLNRQGVSSYSHPRTEALPR